MADRFSFQGFIAAALGPLALGVILSGQDRSRILPLVLLAIFAITMAGYTADRTPRCLTFSERASN